VTLHTLIEACHTDTCIDIFLHTHCIHIHWFISLTLTHITKIHVYIGIFRRNTCIHIFINTKCMQMSSDQNSAAYYHIKITDFGLSTAKAQVFFPQECVCRYMHESINKKMRKTVHTLNVFLETFSKSTQSRNSESVSRGTNSNWYFGLSWICPEKNGVFGFVDFWVVFIFSGLSHMYRSKKSNAHRVVSLT